MKLRHFLGLTVLTVGAYKAYQNRQRLTEFALKTKEEAHEGQITVNQIKNQVASLQNQAKAANQLSDELGHQVKIFQQESLPHVAAISEILEKYKSPTKP